MNRLGKIVLALAIASATAGFALRGRRGETPSDLSAVFEKLDVMIPMRDGVRLHTEVYVPRNTPQPAPFIFERTPYGVTDDDSGITTKFGIYREMISAGYIFGFDSSTRLRSSNRKPKAGTKNSGLLAGLLARTVFAASAIQAACQENHAFDRLGKFK